MLGNCLPSRCLWLSRYESTQYQSTMLLLKVPRQIGLSMIKHGHRHFNYQKIQGKRTCLRPSISSVQFSIPYKHYKQTNCVVAQNAATMDNRQTSPRETMKHDSSDFLRFDRPLGNRCYALLILNFEIPHFTASLWDRAKLRLCADGGANRLYDELPMLFPDEEPLSVRQRFKPDVIKGDLDSIRSDVRNFYEALGTTILDESADQDTTDTHKCVSFITDCTPDLEKSTLTLLVVGALGGRFDHQLGNINVLYKFSNIRIVLVSDHSLVYLLPKSYYHVISVDLSVEGPHCGIIPFGEPSKSTTTTGLKWNLSETPMSFGSLVSTSNIILEEKVTVHSDTDLTWTSSVHIS